MTIAASNSTPAIAVHAPTASVTLFLGNMLMVSSMSRLPATLDVSTVPNGVGSDRHGAKTTGAV